MGKGLRPQLRCRVERVPVASGHCNLRSKFLSDQIVDFESAEICLEYVFDLISFSGKHEYADSKKATDKFVTFERTKTTKYNLKKILAKISLVNAYLVIMVGATFNAYMVLKPR